MIRVGEFLDVKRRLEELGIDSNKTLAILPGNFASARSKSDLVNEGTASTVRVLFRNAGVPETPLEEHGERTPEKVEEAFEWVGPIIFFASTIITQNPQLIDISVGVIANYLTDFFKGIGEGGKNAKLDIVVETKSGSYKRISYEGSVDGLKEIPKIVRSTYDEE